MKKKKKTIYVLKTDVGKLNFLPKLKYLGAAVVHILLVIITQEKLQQLGSILSVSWSFIKATNYCMWQNSHCHI